MWDNFIPINYFLKAFWTPVPNEILAIEDSVPLSLSIATRVRKRTVVMYLFCSGSEWVRDRYLEKQRDYRAVKEISVTVTHTQTHTPRACQSVVEKLGSPWNDRGTRLAGAFSALMPLQRCRWALTHERKPIGSHLHRPFYRQFFKNAKPQTGKLNLLCL